MKNKKEKIGDLIFWDVTFCNFKISDRDTFNAVPNELKEFFLEINGLVAYNGAIQFRGCVHEPNWISLKEIWTGEFCLYKIYDQLKKSDVPIAQDGFGDQFIYRDGHMFLLEIETGDLESLDVNFSDFIKEIQTAPHEYLMVEWHLELEEKNIILKNGQLYNVFPPLIIAAKGKRSVTPVSFEEQITYLMDLYLQIKDLPDGEEVKFVIK